MTRLDLLVVLGPDGEDDDGSGGDEGPDEEDDFAEVGGALGRLDGGGVVGVLPLVGEERALFGRLCYAVLVYVGA